MTKQTDVDDMKKRLRERAKRGSRNTRPVRFNPATATAIREQYLNDEDLSYHALAKLYGTSPHTIRKIIMYKGGYGKPPYVPEDYTPPD